MERYECLHKWILVRDLNFASARRYLLGQPKFRVTSPYQSMTVPACVSGAVSGKGGQSRAFRKVATCIINQDTDVMWNPAEKCSLSPFYCTILHLPHIHTNVVWWAGLKLILMAGSELVIHWLPQEQEWDEDLEFVLKWCIWKCQPCIKPSILFGGLPPSHVVLCLAADGVSSSVAAWSLKASFPQ